MIAVLASHATLTAQSRFPRPTSSAGVTHVAA